MNAPLNDAAQLEYTQELRRRMVSQFLDEGKFPDDPKMLTILLGALKDHDKVTLTLKRIDADGANADADRQAMLAYQKYMADTNGLSPFLKHDPEAIPAPEKAATPAFDASEIPAAPVVPGELEAGYKPVDYDDLMTRMDEAHRKSLA